MGSDCGNPAPPASRPPLFLTCFYVLPFSKSYNDIITVTAGLSSRIPHGSRAIQFSGTVHFPHPLEGERGQDAGTSEDIQRIADQVIGTKGVMPGKLTIISAHPGLS